MADAPVQDKTQVQKVEPPKDALEINGDTSYVPRGVARTFETAKYDISNYEYPANLMTDAAFGGHYAIFYINVQEDSKLIRTDKVSVVSETSAPIGDRGPNVLRNKDKATAANTNATLTGAAASGGVKALTSSGAGAVTAFIAPLFGSALISSQANSATRAVRRIKTAIALPIPNNIAVKYSVDWQDEGTMTGQIVAMSGQAAIDGVDALAKAFESNNKLHNSANVLRSPTGERMQSGLAALVMSKFPNRAQISNATGLTANPLKEQIFNGVDARTFNYEYSFFPHNENEAQNVWSIIKEFKLHMQPEFKDSGDFIYIYPSEFDIYFYKDGKENLNLYRHTSCVLTSVDVNYAPNGNFVTFEDGMPTQITLRLSFTELSMLDKERVQDGM